MSEPVVESIREARAHLADVIDRADREGEPTIITRRGRQVAAVVPIDVLCAYHHYEEMHDARLVAERMASRGDDIPIEDVMAEILGER